MNTKRGQQFAPSIDRTSVATAGPFIVAGYISCRGWGWAAHAGAIVAWASCMQTQQNEVRQHGYPWLVRLHATSQIMNASISTPTTTHRRYVLTAATSSAEPERCSAGCCSSAAGEAVSACIAAADAACCWSARSDAAAPAYGPAAGVALRGSL